MAKIANLTSNLYRLFEKHDTAQEFQEAEQLFEFKTFYERFKPLHGAAKVAQYVFPLFSIGTALTFITMLVYSAIPILELCFAIGLILLGTWEYLKNYLIKDMTMTYYQQKNRLPVGISLLVLVLFIGSVTSSMMGVTEAHQMLDSSISDFKVIKTHEKDSVNSYYDNLINNEKSDLNSFKESITYKGKINLYDKTTNQVIERHNKNLARLEQEKHEALQKLNQGADQELTKVQAKSHQNTFAFGIISLINELLILLCGWFIIFYKAKWVSETRLKQEIGVLENQQVLTLNTNTNSADQVRTNTEVVRTMGFQIGDKDKEIGSHWGSNHQEKDQSLADLIGYLDKHKEVVQLLETGLSVPEIIQKTNVGRTTVFNVKRCLKTLKAK